MQPPLILLFPTCTLIKTTLGAASIVSFANLLLDGMKLYNLLLFARDLMIKFQTKLLATILRTQSGFCDDERNLFSDLIRAGFRSNYAREFSEFLIVLNNFQVECPRNRNFSYFTETSLKFTTFKMLPASRK